MALVKCGECGNEVSTQAKACPRCGAPPANLPGTNCYPVASAIPKQGRGGKVVFLTFCAAIIAAIYFGSEHEKRAPEVALQALVRHSGMQFVVTNTDSYDWQDCDFEVNSDYELKIPHVRAGETLELPSGEFAKSDGTRLTWLAVKPTRMFIYCRRAPSASRSALHGWK